MLADWTEGPPDRIWDILRELAASGLLPLGDQGHHGGGNPVITPYKGRNKPASQKAARRQDYSTASRSSA